MALFNAHSSASAGGGSHPLFPWNHQLSDEGAVPWNSPLDKSELIQLQQVEQLERLLEDQAAKQSAASKERRRPSKTTPSPAQKQRGPIAVRTNSTVPVLPRFTYSVLSNGTLIQIPVS